MSFHSRDYAEIEHGYATTIHKAQGTTVDYSYLLLTGHLDRHGSYVALSRHRQGVAAFYARDEFADLGCPDAPSGAGREQGDGAAGGAGGGSCAWQDGRSPGGTSGSAGEGWGDGERCRQTSEW